MLNGGLAVVNILTGRYYIAVINVSAVLICAVALIMAIQTIRLVRKNERIREIINKTSRRNG